MSETTIDASPKPTPHEPAPVADAKTAADEARAAGDDLATWKAEARKWQAQSVANKTAADELAALKAAQMTETEKAAARLAELESTVKGYQTKEQVAAWKADVAKTSGVPVAALAGSSLEEIQAHADVLKSLITSPAEPRGPLVPTEGTGESKSVSQLSETDLKSMTPKQINDARRSGRLNRLLGVS